MRKKFSVPKYNVGLPGTARKLRFVLRKFLTGFHLYQLINGTEWVKCRDLVSFKFERNIKVLSNLAIYFTFVGVFKK
jgi:hypothetical protein